MQSTNKTRWGGFAAVLSGLLGLVLAPVTAAASIGWSYRPYAGWIDEVPPLVRPLRFYIDPLLALAPPTDVYPTYGRAGISFYLLLLVAVLAIRSLPLGPRGGWLNAGLWLALVGAVLQVLGNIGDYWLGEEMLGHAGWGLSFGLGTLLGSVLFAAGTGILGVIFMRRGLLPAWAAIPLVIWPVIGIALLFGGMTHMPSSWVLPMSAALLLVGIALLLPGRSSVITSRASQVGAG